MKDLRIWLRLPLVALMLVVGGAVAGCEEEGAAEKAGKQIDQAAQDAGEKLKKLSE
jgi:hypothetical protein